MQQKSNSFSRSKELLQTQQRVVANTKLFGPEGQVKEY
jgi:hypothetical protein